MSLPSPTDTGTALVTGASSGLGAALARELAARGYHITLVARRADRLSAVVRQIEFAGGAATILPADLTDPAVRAELPGRVTELGRTVDILVNCAGTLAMGPIASCDPAAQRDVIDLSVSAVADLCMSFVPGMVERHRGAVLTVASLSSFQPMPGMAAYSGAKSFTLHYTQSLAGELAGYGIPVTALCPGPVDTELSRGSGMSDEEYRASMPEPLWETAETVAAQAIDGLAEGRLVVIPGILNKALVAFGRSVPRRPWVLTMGKKSPAMKLSGQRNA